MNLKTLFTIGSILILSVQISYSQKIKGSDTVLPLSQKEAEYYMLKYPEATVTVTGGGSGVGIAALLEGTTDIAQSSRKIKFDEKLKLKNKGKEVVEVIVGFDALAIIVHPENPLNKLTREQIEAIFRGKVVNWKDLGGSDLQIIPYARETSSGTYEFFKESALKYKNYKNGIMSMPATGSVIQSISQTKGAIGYVGLAYINEQVKPIQVSYNQGESFYNPLETHTIGKDYPITRPLYFYYIKSDENKVKPFIDYILSTEGQKIAKDLGFIQVK